MFRWLKLRSQEDADLEREIRFHFAEEERLREDRGEAPESARYSVRRDFGNITLIKEITREMSGSHFIETLLRDVSYAFRQLRRSPGFTVVAVLTLMLGIGANTAIFSIVNSILLRPLPVPDAGRVVALTFQQKGGPLQTQFSYLDLQDIRNQSADVFSGLIGARSGIDGLNVDGKGGHMWTNFVTGNFFSVLGLKPALGRLILPSEGSHAGADPVLVLGHSYWKQRFAGDPNIVGKHVSVNGHPVTIVGVAPAGFQGLISLVDVQGYMPYGMSMVETDAGEFLNDRALRYLVTYARLRPGVTIERAQSELQVIAARLAKDNPKTDEGIAIRVFPERMARPEPDSSGTFIAIAVLFLTLTGLVLLLACLNVANIMLVRAGVRQREMAIRVALGAGRLRLMRQSLTESVLLALLGGLSGMLLGIEAATALGSMPLHTPIPLVFYAHMDWQVFAFTFAVALLAGAVIGLVPAIRSSRGDVADTLHRGGRTIVGGRQFLRSALVVVQVGGSLMLLVAAALFTRSLVNAQKVDLGFDPQHILNVTFDVNEAGYTDAQARQFSQTLLERVRALSGVESASLAFSEPMGYYSASTGVQIPGYQPPRGQATSISYNLVSSDYFRTMRIPILRGRAFLDSDTEKAPRVAVINESMAKQFWPNQESIGRRFQILDDSQHTYEVVGIARNSRARGFSGPYPPYLYIDITQSYSPVQTLHVRSVLPPEVLLPQLERMIERMAPGMPLTGGETMSEALGTLNGLLRYQLGAALAAALGMIGLILAVIGLCGVVSYATAQRTHEIGIRMALGAKASEILKMVVRQGFVLVVGGLLLGLLAAFGLARLLGRFLIGVAGTDPLVFAGVTVLLGVVALAACYIPARRATRVDPMAALRIE